MWTTGAGGLLARAVEGHVGDHLEQEHVAPLQPRVPPHPLQTGCSDSRCPHPTGGLFFWGGVGLCEGPATAS